MTSSSGTNRPASASIQRLMIGGTLTRAKWSLPVSGLRITSARLSDRPEM